MQRIYWWKKKQQQQTNKQKENDRNVIERCAPSNKQTYNKEIWQAS